MMATNEEMKNTTNEELNNASNELSEEEMQDIAAGGIGAHCIDGKLIVSPFYTCVYFADGPRKNPCDMHYCTFCRYMHTKKVLMVCHNPHNCNR